MVVIKNYLQSYVPNTDMAKRVRIFWPEAKTGDPTRPEHEPFFLKLKKKKKLRQYLFNCLL